MCRGVVDALGVSSKNMLGTLEATSLELFSFDQKEGVHGNYRQRLKPRCLFEIELRPHLGDQRDEIIRQTPPCAQKGAQNSVGSMPALGLSFSTIQSSIATQARSSAP